MTESIKVKMSFIQLCESAQVPQRFIEKSIEYGIITPPGEQREDWLFDTDHLQLLTKAARLKNDLGLNWSGLALAIELLEEVQQLRHENQVIKNRLQRFMLD